MTRILVVEDDPNLQRLFKLIFAQAGIEVTAASDGREGLETAIADPPDCIVADSMMPRMSVIEMLMELKRQLSKAPPAILVTASAELPSKEEMQEAGIAEAIAKPFDFGRLISLVKKLTKYSA